MATPSVVPAPLSGISYTTIVAASSRGRNSWRFRRNAGLRRDGVKPSSESRLRPAPTNRLISRASLRARHPASGSISFPARLPQPLGGGLGHRVPASGQVPGGAPHLDVRLQAAALDRPVEEAGVRLHGDLRPCTARFVSVYVSFRAEAPAVVVPNNRARFRATNHDAHPSPALMQRSSISIAIGPL